MVGKVTFVRTASQVHKKGSVGNYGFSAAKWRFCELHIWRCSAEMRSQNPGLGEPLAFPFYILSEQRWTPHVSVTLQPRCFNYAHVKATSSPKAPQQYCWSQCRHWYSSSNERRVWVAILTHLFTAKTTYEVQSPRANTKYIWLAFICLCWRAVTGSQESHNLPKEQLSKIRIHICVRTVKWYIFYVSAVLLVLFIRQLCRKQEVLFLNPEC